MSGFFGPLSWSVMRVVCSLLRSGQASQRCEKNQLQKLSLSQKETQMASGELTMYVSTASGPSAGKGRGIRPQVSTVQPGQS